MTQEEALTILKLGYNVFLTGSAGSGKTHVLKQYLSYLHEKDVVVGITASTGVAATHIGGITINSWAGIGIKPTLSVQEIEQLTNRSYLRKRFLHTKVLVIDEVSMLSQTTLEMVDKVFKAFTGSKEPFGGIQIVLCGDFFQLPPITQYPSPRPSPLGRGGAEGTSASFLPVNVSAFIYSSPIWEELDLKVCYLDHVFRQEDSEFLQVLQEIRTNSVSKAAIKLLAARLYKHIDEISTRLYTHSVNVDAINSRELNKLTTPLHLFQMTSSGNEYLTIVMKKSCLAPEKLYLREGAAVMFVKNNFEKGYVNGTLGTVVAFSKNNYPVVELHNGELVTVTPSTWEIEEDGEIKASLKQLPLRLAWAVTIHKSQGMSLDAAEIDLGKPFAPGMGYVALSRVRSLEGISLLGLNHKALQVHQGVVSFDRALQEQSKKDAQELENLSWIDTQVFQMAHLRDVLPDKRKLPRIVPQDINVKNIKVLQFQDIYF